MRREKVSLVMASVEKGAHFSVLHALIFII